jgi:hypothetical protein
MKKIVLIGGALFAILFVISAQAGTFWFPLEGLYPYSVQVTAVPDLDQRPYYMRSRMNEVGRRSNGCLPDNSYQCSNTFDAAKSVWGYLKDGGGNWEFDGVQYNDLTSTSKHAYLWYDNHRGYDFITTQSNAPVHTVEAGTFCGITPKYGQVCVQHILPSGTYKTYYTHMANIPSSISSLGFGQKIAKWAKVGTVSNVGTSEVHLHFVVQKYDPKHLSYSRRKVTDDGWIVVDPYGLKNGPYGSDIEPYLWN